MKRITLPIVFLFVGGALAAQTPPTPPAPAPRAAPAPAPTPAPRAMRLDIDMERLRDEIRLQTEDARRIARDASREVDRAAIEASRVDAQWAREQARAAVEASRLDEGWVRDQVRAAVDVARNLDLNVTIPPMPAMPPMALSYSGDRFDHLTAPRAWAPSDPADSLYRAARDLLSRGDWGRAARMFADIQKNFPKSAYANDAQYYEAYARYKIGTTDELRQASKLLEPMASRISPSANTNDDRRFAFASNGARTSDGEIISLYARINGVLAQRGDSDAAAKVARVAQAGGAACDQEDLQVRTEALNALSQMDPAQALPLLRRVLDRKDECSAQLRRNAVFILGRRADNESAGILMTVAKNDPNTSVRAEAINYLARVPGDAGVSALEEMLKSEQDERIQRAAVRALMSSDNQRARSSMRALIDRKDAPVSLRVEAINSFNSDRSTTDDGAYLRGLFARADNDQLKNAILNAVARMGGSDNDQWLLALARNTNESSSVRASALSRLARSQTVTTADLSKLYDASSESYEIRNRIISLLGNRKDPEATDKLIDIVKNSTVINNRTQAINALMNKKDPRAQQLLMDILDGKKP